MYTINLAIIHGDGFVLCGTARGNLIRRDGRERGALPYETSHPCHSEKLKGDEDSAVAAREKKQILRPEIGLGMTAKGRRSE